MKEQTADLPLASTWRFVLPSLIGGLFFLTPLKYEGNYTILLGVVIDLANVSLGDSKVWLVLSILTLTGIITPLVSWLRLPLPPLHHPFRHLVDVTTPWVILRIVGAICAWLIHLKLGPEWIWHASTGGVALYDLAANIVILFLFASLLLPFLTDYGFMEFVGTACRNVFRRVFNLPGRSAIDAMASWLTAAAVGIMITSQQYQRGFYTARESAVIATNFSIASLPFCLFTTEFIGLGHMFIPIYITLFLLGIVAAIVVPRLPPLSNIADTYYAPVGKQIHESSHADGSLLNQALIEARRRAATAPGPREFVATATNNVLDIWFGLLPAVVAVGMAGMAIAEFTPIMQWLSWPFIGLLELLQIPEAAKAAPTMLVGFFDMFLPAAIGKAIESELTRFVICVVSLTQLIYMSEVGVLLLKSPLPLNFWNLIQIFLIRTLLILPMAAAVAHLIF